MSTHCQLQLERMQSLRQIQRQTRLLDLRLQQLREKLCATRLHRLCHSCCHQPCTRHLARKVLCAKLDLERRMNRLRKLGMMLNSCCSQSHLIDVKGFDPRDITVIVRDGKVTVAAERKEECSTCTAKSCTYRKFIKEFCLPPGVNEVTCSVEPGSIMKIEPVSKCCAIEPPKCCAVEPPKCCSIEPPKCCPILPEPKCCPILPEPKCCPILPEPKCCPVEPEPKCCSVEPEPKCCSFLCDY